MGCLERETAALAVALALPFFGAASFAAAFLLAGSGVTFVSPAPNKIKVPPSEFWGVIVTLTRVHANVNIVSTQRPHEHPM